MNINLWKPVIIAGATLIVSACAQGPGANMPRDDREAVYGAGLALASFDICGHKMKPAVEAEGRRIISEGLGPYIQKYGGVTVNKVMLDGRKDAMAQVAGLADPCDDRAARQLHGDALVDAALK